MYVYCVRSVLNTTKYASGHIFGAAGAAACEDHCQRLCLHLDAVRVTFCSQCDTGYVYKTQPSQYVCPPPPCFRFEAMKEKGGRLDIVMDNAGYELFTDLCLALWLSKAGYAKKVRERGLGWVGGGELIPPLSTPLFSTPRSSSTSRKSRGLSQTPRMMIFPGCLTSLSSLVSL